MTKRKAALAQPGCSRLLGWLCVPWRFGAWVGWLTLRSSGPQPCGPKEKMKLAQPACSLALGWPWVPWRFGAWVGWLVNADLGRVGRSRVLVCHPAGVLNWLPAGPAQHKSSAFFLLFRLKSLFCDSRTWESCPSEHTVCRKGWPCTQAPTTETKLMTRFTLFAV